MKHGGSPTTARGEAVALDHVLPVSIVPELAAKFYNLEIVLAKENQAKGAKVGKWEMDFARKLHTLGLLSEA